MNVEIRQASAEDVSLLVRLIREAFADVAERYGLTPGNCPSHPAYVTDAGIREGLSCGGRFFLAVEEGAACGCVGLVPDREGAYSLVRLAVLPDYRRRGLGSLLARRVLDEARRMGLRGIGLGIIAAETHLQRLYERHGFRVVETRSFPHLPFEVTQMVADPDGIGSAVLPPPLKWAGGKRWLVPRLRELYERHRHRRLVEPFAGGLAVALGLLPERALLSDANPHVINLYRRLGEGLAIEMPMANDSDCYYAARERFNRILAEGGGETPEAAALFYYLNRTGYNGLCRFNSSGGFNVPFGRYKTINYTRDFSAYAPVLSRWEFRCGDFEGLPLGPEDFVYADPPYDVPFTRYSRDDFRWDDQVRLARWLAAHPGPVVASNQATPRVLDLYRGLGFEMEVLPAPRRIACNGNREPADEMLAARNVSV